MVVIYCPLCFSSPLSDLLIPGLGNNVAVTVFFFFFVGGVGEGGAALTRSQRGEVTHAFPALPWGLVKPIDCDRVPSFL